MAEHTPGTIVEAVWEMFLSDGSDHTAQEIADRLGITAARVRKALNDQHGFSPQGITQSWEFRVSRDRSYGTERGGHKVTVYGPSREGLRRRLLSEGRTDG